MGYFGHDETESAMTEVFNIMSTPFLSHEKIV